MNSSSRMEVAITAAEEMAREPSAEPRPGAGRRSSADTTSSHLLSSGWPRSAPAIVQVGQRLPGAGGARGEVSLCTFSTSVHSAYGVGTICEGSHHASGFLRATYERVEEEQKLTRAPGSEPPSVEEGVSAHAGRGNGQHRRRLRGEGLVDEARRPTLRRSVPVARPLVG